MQLRAAGREVAREEHRFGQYQARLADGLAVAYAFGEFERGAALVERARRVGHRQVAAPERAQGLARVPLVAVLGGERDGALQILAGLFEVAAQDAQVAERV